MLGFAPLAKITLADDGVVESAAQSLTANNVAAGNPSVAASTFAQGHVLETTTINKTVTVVFSGGNKYAIDGVTTPVLTLERGKTYIFDVSDSTMSGHPFRFKDGSGNTYSTGVTVSGTTGQSGATVTLVVAANAPDDLRYYCTVHGNGMGNTISVVDRIINVVTGAPAVASIVLSQTDTLIATSVATGAPAVASPAITQVHNLTATSVATGAPAVANVTQTENISLTATSIVAGSAQISAPTFNQDQSLVCQNVAAAPPSASASTITQVHVITPTAVNAGAVAVSSANMGEAETFVANQPVEFTEKREHWI